MNYRSLAACALCLFSGCGKGDEEPPNVAVEGKVILPGKTNDYWIVTFTSQGTKEEKRYQSNAFKQGQPFTISCPRGKYKATLAMVTTQAGAGGAHTANPGKAGGIPNIYRNPFESPWTVEVPGEGVKGLVLKVE